MYGLQEIFDAALEDQIGNLKANLVRKKFREYGITLTQTQVSGIVDAGDDDYTLELDDAQHEAAKLATGGKFTDNITIDFTDDDIQAATAQSSSIFSEMIPTVVENAAKTILQELKKSFVSEVRDLRSREAAFEARLARRWKTPFQLFDIYLAIVKEAGADFNLRYRPQAAKETDIVFDVLIRLHARACQIASEVIKLLKAGFADGGHARWRSLHEVATVALFIQKHGSEVAERYVVHEVVESHRAAQQYQNYCKAIAHKPFSKAKMEKFLENYKLALERFGTSFGTAYGWAAVVLGSRNPTFADIEKNVELDKFRPYYKMASHNVHANPTGITFKLGLLPKSRRMLLAGPSDVGLADPLHGTAISLLQILTTLMVMRPNIDHLSLCAVLTKLQREIGDESLKSQKAIESFRQQVAKRKR